MQIVSYLRVSTARQGASGLGLEAQRAAVQRFAAADGHDIVAEYVEVESGRKADRPQLAAALGICRLHRATLVIAKLDRLARNVAFIAGLMDGNVEFVACDMPHANRLTLHMMAAMAEHEREMISQRTKAALAAAKARGTKLGNPNGAIHLRSYAHAAAAVSSAVRSNQVASRAGAMMPLIKASQDRGVVSARAIALELNARGMPSPRGGTWSQQSVRRLLQVLNGATDTALPSSSSVSKEHPRRIDEGAP